MRGKLRGKLTYANVMATIAVFVALGGSSYAITQGSVDSRAIKDSAVRSVDVKNRTLRDGDIRSNTITSRVVRDGALLGEDFRAGELPKGPPGEPGAPGADAVRLFGFVQDNGGAGTATVEYGSGLVAVDDPPGDTPYLVTFARDLQGCVVQAVPGSGDPSGTGTSTPAGVNVGMAFGAHNQAEVNFIRADGEQVDTAFLVSGIC
jgi:hypothetical protein